MAGLSQQEARKRLAKDGANVLVRRDGRHPLAMFAAQFASPLLVLLAAAAAVSGILHEVADAVAIAVIILLNACVGFFQEYRAERALLALKQLTAPRARVVRDGQTVDVAAADVVVGEVLALEAGDVVAADARVLSAHALSTFEAPLTGESTPVDKRVDDRVYLGAAVATGTARAEVFATGMQTELGKIAHMLAKTEAPATPLERRLAGVSRMLLFVCVAIVLMHAAICLMRGQSWMEVLVTAVSLAVAAVPEGLPAVVTIALALGVQKMARRHVLVRRLAAVETLGCATVICTDKTGTLTSGKMSVRDHWTASEPKLFFAAAACCDADMKSRRGDPTELALLDAAARVGVLREDIERELPRTDERPFSSERRMMSIRRSNGVSYVKGAVETVLARVYTDTREANRQALLFAERGMRVLAIASTRREDEDDLTLHGLVGIADPPRHGVAEAIAQAQKAGIKTVMITGDHPRTARTIAREIGLLQSDDVQSGDDASQCVYARASAADKLAIVAALQARGEVVAMTGDGVNDAPALEKADIGIAMGKTGTEVTREAADMVLTDDAYESIIAAVREGRGIYDNIQRALVYLLAGNAAELLAFTAAALLGMPMPLLPLQLLCMNLVTDGLPALALVTERVDADALSKQPRAPSAPILGGVQWTNIAWTGALQAACGLAVFAWALSRHEVAAARNLAFCTLVFGEVLRALSSRSDTKTIFELGIMSNPRVLAVVLATVLAQLLIAVLPATQVWFQMGEVPAADLAIALVVGFVPMLTVESAKWCTKARGDGSAKGVAS